MQTKEHYTALFYVYVCFMQFVITNSVLYGTIECIILDSESFNCIGGNGLDSGLIGMNCILKNSLACCNSGAEKLVLPKIRRKDSPAPIRDTDFPKSVFINETLKSYYLTQKVHILDTHIFILSNYLSIYRLKI